MAKHICDHLENLYRYADAVNTLMKKLQERKVDDVSVTCELNAPRATSDLPQTPNCTTFSESRDSNDKSLPLRGNVMVRIKNRYVLVQILYPCNIPTATPNPSSIPARSSTVTSLYAPTPDCVTSQILIRQLRNSLSTLFGEHGLASCSNGLTIKYWSNATSVFIVRCRRECLRLVWAAICFSHNLRDDKVASSSKGASSGCDAFRLPEHYESQEVVMRVLRVSGTIKKCEQEAVKKARELLGRAKGLQVAAEAEGGDEMARIVSGGVVLELDEGENEHDGRVHPNHDSVSMSEGPISSSTDDEEDAKATQD